MRYGTRIPHINIQQSTINKSFNHRSYLEATYNSLAHVWLLGCVSKSRFISRCQKSCLLWRFKAFGQAMAITSIELGDDTSRTHTIHDSPPTNLPTHQDSFTPHLRHAYRNEAGGGRLNLMVAFTLKILNYPECQTSNI